MSDVRDYLITYKARPRAHVETWAVIEGVPAQLAAVDVEAVIEAWRQWPAWQQRRGPQGVLTIRRRRGSDEIGAHGTVLAWDQLVPAMRRLTVECDGALYQGVARAAARRGLSLQEWVRRELTQAAAADVADVIERGIARGHEPAPGFIDVELPGMPA